MKFSIYQFHTVTYQPNTNLTAGIKGVTYDETKAVAMADQQYIVCQHANGQFCRLNASFQPLMNLQSCVTALYAKNNQAIGEQCSLSVSNAPPTFIPVAVALNLWIIP